MSPDEKDPKDAPEETPKASEETPKSKPKPKRKPTAKKPAKTAAEVEKEVSEEAAKSIPRADDDAEDARRPPRRPPRPRPSRRPSPRTSPSRPPRSARKKADDDDAEGRGDAEEKKPAEKPARKRDQPRARQPGEAPVLVHAKARYVRTSARKARLVCDHIRGKDVEQARAILSFTPRGAAKPWMKLLESAIANAEHNHELVGDELKIASVHADEGPTLKRYRPRAMGRATRIRKRTSHLSITLTPKE